MLKASLGVVLAALMLGGCVYEQSASREAQEGGSPGRLAPPPRPTARPPMQAMAPPQPDRVRGEDLARLSPGTGIAGPEAEPAPLTRRTPYPSRIYVQAASFVTREQAERARRSIAGLGPSGVYTAYVDDQLRYRVRIGPLRTPGRSESVRAALVRRGYSDAIVVRD